MSKSYDSQKALDLDQAKEADGKQQLAENIEMREIPIERLRIPHWHARKSPRRDIDSYAEFIAKIGVYRPVSVIESEDQMYDIFDGGRTLEALKQNGHKTVICLVHKDMTADEASYTRKWCLKEIWKNK